MLSFMVLQKTLEIEYIKENPNKPNQNKPNIKVEKHNFEPVLWFQVSGCFVLLFSIFFWK